MTAHVLTGPAIDVFAMRTQLSAVKLEGLGMRHSRGSVTARVKRHYGLTGSRAKVEAALEAMVRQGEAFLRGETLPWSHGPLRFLGVVECQCPACHRFAVVKLPDVLLPELGADGTTHACLPDWGGCGTGLAVPK
jgi:hypothetical protein